MLFHTNRFILNGIVSAVSVCVLLLLMSATVGAETVGDEAADSTHETESDTQQSTITTPQGALTLALKSTSDSGSSTSDNITNNTTLTFTVSNSRAFGDTSSDTGPEILVIYKNSPCASGAAIPSVGWTWLTVDNRGLFNGWSVNLHSDWRQTYGSLDVSGSPLQSSYDVTINTLLYTATNPDTVLTPSDGVKCFIATYVPDPENGHVQSTNTSTGFEITMDRTVPVPTMTFTSGFATATPTLRVSNLENNGTVRIYTDSACDTTAIGSAVSVGATETEKSIALTGRTTSDTFYAKHTDIAGNTSCSDGMSNRLMNTVDAIIAAPGNAQTTLTWETANTDNVTGWQYDYKTTASGASWTGWADMTGSVAGTTSFTVPSLTNGTSYIFRVRAKAPNGQFGTPSPEAFATPGASIDNTDFDSDDDNLIEITTLQQLNAMRWDLNGDAMPDSGTSTANRVAYYNAFATSRSGFFCDSCAGYELMNDLDFDTGTKGTRSDDLYHNGGNGWNSIGDDTNNFNTTFEGNGFVIDNLYMSRPVQGSGHRNEEGLFGTLGENGIISTVGVRNISITTLGDYRKVGAIVGNNRGGTIRNSYSTGTISSLHRTTFHGIPIGGLVGYVDNRYDGKVINSYSTVNISTERDERTVRIGGLVGHNDGNRPVIKNSYSIGTLTGDSNNSIGGLVNANNHSKVTNSYWDTETSNQATSGGGTGKTTAELQGEVDYTGIYAAWDDEDVDGDTVADAAWDFGTTDQYPVLSYGGHSVDKQRLTLRASPGGTKATLIWNTNSEPNINGYQYRYKTGSGSYSAWTDVPGAVGTTTTYTVTGLTASTAYTFEVRTKLIGSTTGRSSNEVSVTTATDTDDPVVGTVRDDSSAGTVLAGTRHLTTGNTLRIIVPIVDRHPPSTAPTVALRFGSSATDRTPITRTHTYSISGGALITEYPYTYTVQAGDVGTLSYKITGVTDTATTPNSMTDQTVFTSLQSVYTNASTALIFNIGSTGSPGFTNDTTPEFSVSRPTAFGGTTGDTVAVYYKSGACATLPTSATTTALTTASWTPYATASVAAAATTTQSDITSATPLATTGAHCFLVALVNGTTVTTDTYAQMSVTVDTTAPTLTSTRIGSDSTANYRVTATDTSATTGRTKDNVASSACTADADTTGAGWTDYTPGTLTGTAHDIAGRCVIVTDAAGNAAAIHLQDFTLDFDANGSFEPNKDAILLYLYSNQGSSVTELTAFTHNGRQGTATDAIAGINAVKDIANTPLDMDGNGTFTANTDGAIPYLHSGQGYDATSLTSFTHNGSQTTASNAITLVRGAITPNWP